MEKVCFFVFGFPPDFSGATLQTLYFSGFLKKKGVDCFFLTFTYKPENLKLEQPEGHRVYRFLRKPTKKLLIYHCKLFYHLFAQNKNYSILYINGNDGQFWTIFWGVIFSKIFSKKIFVELNMDIPNVDPLSIIGTNSQNLKLAVLKKVDKFISNSTAITKNFEKSYPGAVNVQTIYYGTDVHRFKKIEDKQKKINLREKLGFSPGIKIAVCCGAVSKRKGVDFLLDCWEKICENYPEECLLVLVGPYKGLSENEGSFKDFSRRILKRVNSAPLKNKVCLTGKVDNVHEYLQCSDLFLFTSRQEGSPSVIREAMAVSLPVISLNLPDITSEMIDNDHSGVIIGLNNYEVFADYLNHDINDSVAKKRFVSEALKVMQEPEHAVFLGENARKKIENNYSFETKAEKYLELFTKGLS